MTDEGGTAFPSHGSMGEVAQEGMSLRDWFAGMALQGMLARATSSSITADLTVESAFSISAYLFADAMIAARKVNK